MWIPLGHGMWVGGGEERKKKKKSSSCVNLMEPFKKCSFSHFCCSYCIINVFSGGVMDSGMCKGSISELRSRDSSLVVALVVGCWDPFGELVPSGGV